MLRTELTILAIAVLLCGEPQSLAAQTDASQTPSIQVSVAGLRVVTQGAGRNGSELKPFRESPGLTVALLLEAPEGSLIVEIEDDDCSLESLASAKGASLIEDASWSPFPEISEAGDAGLIEFSTRAVPRTQDTALRAGGAIQVRLARDVKRLPAEGYAPAKGTEFSGPWGTFKVQVSEPDAEATSYRLVLETSSATAELIRDLRFTDRAGDNLDVNGRGQMTMGSRTQIELYFNSSQTPSHLQVEWFEDLEEVTVPFDVPITLSPGA